LTAAALVVLLSSCSGDGDDATPRYIEGFVGGVATDEPQAAFVGRDILAANGNAVDAAVATYFALAVTLPSSASLGGGGVCVVFDAERNQTRTIDFLARAPSAVDPGSPRAAAIPGAVRGFYTLHAYYGRLHWSELVAPAERLARFGATVSRAYAEDLAVLGDALRAEPSFVRIFADPDDGGLVDEGDTVVQVELASVLSRLRNQGPAGFYTGPQAAEFLRAVDQAGGSIPRMDLDGYQAAWRPTLEVALDGNQMAHVASPPPSGGVITAQILGMLAEADRYADATPGERGHLLVEASSRAFADREQWQQAGDAARVPAPDLVAPERIKALFQSYRADARQPADPSRRPGAMLENPAAASIVTVDRDGSAVACSVTLNSLFGTGRVAAGTGILLASLPGPGGRGATALTPMVVIDDDKEDFYFAAAASGGSAAPTAVAGVAAEVLLVGETLDRAIAQRRVMGAIDLDRAFVERGADEELIAGLRQRGHAVALTGGLGRVNAIACRAGLPDAPQTCNAAADPRGSGLAIMAD
jgi:gamma-glutamyltranspeptidase/glutathione hydrolase